MDRFPSEVQGEEWEKERKEGRHPPFFPSPRAISAQGFFSSPCDPLGSLFASKLLAV